jgi:hypothetical protein
MHVRGGSFSGFTSTTTSPSTRCEKFGSGTIVGPTRRPIMVDPSTCSSERHDALSGSATGRRENPTGVGSSRDK